MPKLCQACGEYARDTDDLCESCFWEGKATCYMEGCSNKVTPRSWKSPAHKNRFFCIHCRARVEAERIVAVPWKWDSGGADRITKLIQEIKNGRAM